jgi:hypothetical protein
LARLVDLSQDEERAIEIDLDRDLGVFDAVLFQSAFDLATELGGGETSRLDIADQRESDSPRGIDVIEPRQVVLAEHDDAHPIARVEPVGGVGDDGDPRRRQARAKGQGCARRG